MASEGSEFDEDFTGKFIIIYSPWSNCSVGGGEEVAIFFQILEEWAKQLFNQIFKLLANIYLSPLVELSNVHSLLQFLKMSIKFKKTAQNVKIFCSCNRWCHGGLESKNNIRNFSIFDILELSAAERIQKQRLLLNKRLGLDVAANFGIDTHAIFSNQDLVQSQVTAPVKVSFFILC